MSTRIYIHVPPKGNHQQVCLRVHTSERLTSSLTSEATRESREEDHKEGGGVLPRVDEVREPLPGGVVSSQALCEAEPGWQGGQDGADGIRH